MSKETSNDKVIYQTLYPIVEQHLSDKKVQRKFKESVEKYLDKNSEILTASGPYKKLMFNYDEKDVFTEASGLSDEVIAEALKKSSHVDKSFKLLNQPTNYRATLMIIYFLKHHDTAMLDTVSIFYACYIYARRYGVSFKYEPQEGVMRYAINQLSNKYLIKQHKTLIKALLAMMMGAIKTYKEKLFTEKDKFICDFIYTTRTRISSFIKFLYDAFNKAYESGAYLNLDSDSYDEDNYHIADNQSYQTQNALHSTLNKLSMHGENMRLVSLAARMNGVSQNELRNVLAKIIDNNMDEVEDIIESIINVFILTPEFRGKSLSSKFFLVKAIELYKKTNTTNPQIIKIREVLDAWLTEYSAKYRMSNREPTLSAFRRAIYTYFVLEVQQNTH